MPIETLSSTLLMLAGPFLGLALAVTVLVTTRVQTASAVWLALWLAGLAVRFGKSTLHALHGLESWGLNLGLAGMLAVAPAAFLLARALVEPPRAVSARDLAHFIPSALFLAGAAWIPNRSGDPVSALIYVALLAAWWGYSLAAVRLAWRTRGTLDVARRELLMLVLGTTLVFGLLLTMIFAGARGLYLLACALFALAAIGLTVRLFGNASLLESLSPRRAEPATAEQVALVARARAVLAEVKLLSDPSCSLVRVARRLGVPGKRLSVAINRVTGESFRTLLNAARIEGAKVALRGTSDSIEAVAERYGFSSAATFHRAFRRHTGTTPAQWRMAP